MKNQQNKGKQIVGGVIVAAFVAAIIFTVTKYT